MQDTATITEIIGARYETVFEAGAQTFVTEFAPPEGFFVTELQVPGLPGADGAGGITQLADDPNPTLGGHLSLGNFNINGQLENSGLILDGGLLEGL